MSENNIGKELWEWANYLFPLCRSLTGQDNLKTLKFISSKLSNFKILYAKTGSKAYDWKIPKEWNIKKAYISDLNGNKIIDFKDNNLHIVGYSVSVDKVISYKDLIKNLHTLRSYPNAIPYRTSYYKKDWGFCLEYNKFKKLKKEKYKVLIDSKFSNGKMHYGEFYIKGKSKKEILFSTYICHPSMANNEISGIVLATALARMLNQKKNLYYSYRIIFIPETIGSIYYISQNYKKLKKNVLAGYVISCVGDDNNYSYIETKNATTLSDKIAKFVFKNNKINYKLYSFLTRGSDERQFCSPNIDLPIGSILRTRHGQYKQYHTSKDDMKYVSPKGFQNSFKLYKDVISVIEKNLTYKLNTYCEPFFKSYDLIGSIGGGVINVEISNFCAYCDGYNDLIDISKTIKCDFDRCQEIALILLEKKIIKLV